MNKYLNWLNVKKEILRLGFPFKEYKQVIGSGAIEEHLKLFEYSLKSKECIVEIGSYQGKSTWCLAKPTKKLVYAIDPQVKQKCKDGVEYLGSKEDFEKNTRNLKNVFHLYEYSFNVDWGKKIGLLFIDGDHSYEAVKQDFEKYAPYVIKNGFVLFHDSFVKRFGVKKFRQELPENYGLIETVNELTVYQKGVC